MNIRNLIRIQDSIDRITDSSLEEYRETSRALNDNFMPIYCTVYLLL